MSADELKALLVSLRSQNKSVREIATIANVPESKARYYLLKAKLDGVNVARPDMVYVRTGQTETRAEYYDRIEHDINAGVRCSTCYSPFSSDFFPSRTQPPRPYDCTPVRCAARDNVFRDKMDAIASFRRSVMAGEHVG